MVGKRPVHLPPLSSAPAPWPFQYFQIQATDKMGKSSKKNTIQCLENDDSSIVSSGCLANSLPSELGNAVKHGSYFPQSTPSRPVYLAVRFTSATLGIILLTLAVVAARAVDRPKWLSPILSPAINAWSASTIDILFVKWKDRRYPRWQRLLHDGAIGIGCSVAGGFLVAFSLGDIRGLREGAGRGTMAVGWLILFCMFAEAALHLGISVAAAREILRVSRFQRSEVV
ncbi:hypothetical protein GE09DRAFT_746340 [Coniochaeta sp. 2T2.1]|nr:hypothetical protein GE09DRAFT_746340 [Coniochaeta sp. 2T2.1]